MATRDVLSVFGFVVVVGCGGSGTSAPIGTASTPDAGGSAQGAAPRGPIAVHGTVVDFVTAAPVAGVDVRIGDRPIVKTDAQGHFSFDTVDVPYTLVIHQSLGQETFRVYVGLTRSDPYVFDGQQPATNAVTSGDITLSGCDPTLAPLFAFHGTHDVALAQTGTVAACAAPGRMVSGWLDGAPDSVGLLRVLQVGAASSRYGEHDLQFTLGTTSPGFDVPLASVPTRAIAVTGTAPTGYTLDAATATIAFPDGAAIGLRAGATTTDPVLVPRLASGSVEITQMARSPAQPGAYYQARATVDANQTALALTFAKTLPTAARIELDKGPRFAWEAGDLPLHHLTVHTVGGPPSITILITTADTTAGLPDLAPFAVAFTPGSQVSWQVVSTGPVATTDGYVAVDGRSHEWAGSPNQTYTAP